MFLMFFDKVLVFIFVVCGAHFRTFSTQFSDLQTSFLPIALLNRDPESINPLALQRKQVFILYVVYQRVYVKSIVCIIDLHLIAFLINRKRSLTFFFVSYQRVYVKSIYYRPPSYSNSTRNRKMEESSVANADADSDTSFESSDDDDYRLSSSSLDKDTFAPTPSTGSAGERLPRRGTPPPPTRADKWPTRPSPTSAFSDEGQVVDSYEGQVVLSRRGSAVHGRPVARGDAWEWLGGGAFAGVWGRGEVAEKRAYPTGEELADRIALLFELRAPGETNFPQFGAAELVDREAFVLASLCQKSAEKFGDAGAIFPPFLYTHGAGVYGMARGGVTVGKWVESVGFDEEGWLARWWVACAVVELVRRLHLLGWLHGDLKVGMRRLHLLGWLHGDLKVGMRRLHLLGWLHGDLKVGSMASERTRIGR